MQLGRKSMMGIRKRMWEAPETEKSLSVHKHERPLCLQRRKSQCRIMPNGTGKFSKRQRGKAWQARTRSLGFILIVIGSH